MDLVRQINSLYYEEKLSMSQVGKRLGINMWRVRSLMRSRKMPRRTPAESNNINFLKSPLSYNKLSKLNLKQRLLHQAGIMLYWAEGTKTGKHTVDLANSDKNIIRIFLKMLRKIYRVRERKIRILLYCYANQNIEKLIAYWSNLLHISTSQFIKPYVR